MTTALTPLAAALSIVGDVAEIAERQHAGQLHARESEPDRTRAGGEHQVGVGQRRAVGEAHAADVRIDRDRGVAVEQRDAALAPPRARISSSISDGATSRASTADSSTRL